MNFLLIFAELLDILGNLRYHKYNGVEWISCYHFILLPADTQKAISKKQINYS